MAQSGRSAMSAYLSAFEAKRIRVAERAEQCPLLAGARCDAAEDAIGANVSF